jgi:HK97 family phage prohead protease|tara:strand:+ start:3594 stop:4883 length:1290 start_codon:yes stop_codon:yes gene_type:complete
MPWTDYPQAATDNATRALKIREDEGTDCGTPVGWESARIIANKEAITEQRLPRVYSFLSRAKTYDQGSFKDEDGKQICGSIMYAAWGGDEMHRWAERTLENMEEEKSLRHIKSVEETATEIIITYGKAEPMEEAGYDKEEERAEAGELSVGDFVSWDSSGGRSQGVVRDITTDGQIEADSGFKVNGTAEDPAALISVYEYDSEEKAFVERKPPLRVAHLFSTLTKVDGAEVRSLNEVVEQRAYDGEIKAAAESRTVEGYASVFNSMSEDLGFREVILPGAFSDVLDNDVRALYNHDSNYLLARTTSGTLELKEDDKGLYYRFEMPNTSYGNDMLELFRRGDLTQSSFGFTVEKDNWRMEDGQQVRYIERVGSLFDVSPVVFPAYNQASSGLRSAEPNGEGEAEEARETPTEELNYNLHNALIKLAKDEC